VLNNNRLITACEISILVKIPNDHNYGPKNSYRERARIRILFIIKIILIAILFDMDLDNNVFNVTDLGRSIIFFR
jgi:hypothetical protein